MKPPVDPPRPPRRRVVTAATLRARAAKAAAESTADKRLRLARQFIEALHDYDSPPDQNDPEVLEIVRSHQRFPTADLYAMRDRALNVRKNLDRRYPDRVRPSPIPYDDIAFASAPVGKPPHRFFKGTDITAITKPKDFMRVLDRLGSIPQAFLDETLCSTIMQLGWAYPEITPDETRYDMVLAESKRHEWDPPLYTRSKAERKGTIYE